MSHKGRILWIEDNIQMYGLVMEKLVVAGYDVIGAETPEEGLDYVRRTRPDLILLDLYLPGTDGADLYCQLKEEHNLAGIPIAIYSVEDKMESKLAAYGAGVDAFISKSISTDDLTNADLSGALLFGVAQ